MDESHQSDAHNEAQTFGEKCRAISTDGRSRPDTRDGSFISARKCNPPKSYIGAQDLGRIADPDYVPSGYQTEA